MSYISIDNLTTINAELTNYCNAACPMCARYHIDGKLVKDKVNNMHTSLAFLQEKIGEDVVKKLQNFYSCGNFGDGAMNPECLDIYSWIRNANPNILLTLHTNGGARNEDFWQSMAKLGVRVIFAIDGLEDTNHIYRRNVKWEKLINNVKAFINAGGDAGWDMLVFKHNEHQVEACRQFSKELGFNNFTFKQSSRWSDFDSNGQWKEINELVVGEHTIKKVEMMNAPEVGSGGNSQKLPDVHDYISRKPIRCKSFDLEDNVEIYLAVNGDVSPCCYLGDLRMHESKSIIKDYSTVNLNDTSLHDILQSDFFKELDRGIQGIANAKRLQTCYFTCGVKGQ